MQRIGANFVIKQSWSVLKPGGITLELYEMPNGQFQFGKNQDAQVITSIEQVADFDPPTQARVAQRLAQQASLPPPIPVIDGLQQAPNAQDTATLLVRVVQALDPMTQAKLLENIQGFAAPLRDSVLQGQQGEPAVLPPARLPFVLPPSARYVDPNRPESGYLTPTGALDDHRRPIDAWHPTPTYLIDEDRLDTLRAGETAPITAFDAESRQVQAAPDSTPRPDVTEELAQARSQKDLVGAGSTTRRARR